MPRLSAGVASASLGNYAAIALALLTNVFLTRTVGAHEFGRLALLLMASQIALLFISNWTQTALVRFGAREHTEHGVVARAFWDRLLLMAPGALLAMTLGVVLAPWLAAYLEIPLQALWLLSAHVLLGMVFAAGAAVLQATQRMPRYGLALAIDRAAALASVVVASQLVSLDAVGALAAYAAGTAVSSIWVFASVRRVVFVRVPLDRARLAELLRFSLPIAAGTWAGLFGSQWIDLIVMRYFLPLSDLGLFSLAYQISGGVQQLTVIAGAMLLPRLSSLVAADDHHEVDLIFARVIPYWVLAYSIVVATLIGLSEVLVPLVFGPDFGSATGALWILLLATMAAALFAAFQPLLLAHAIVWPISLGVTVAVGANIVLDLVLIPRYGIAGSALATIVSYAASALITLASASVRLRARTVPYLAFLIPPFAALACAVVLDGALLVVAVGPVVAVAALVPARMFGLTTGPLRAAFARASTVD